MTPSRRTRATAAALAVALHLAPFVRLPAAVGPPPPKPVPIAARLAGSPELLDRIEAPGDPHALHLNCPSTYEGIGVKLGWTGRIAEIARGWAADRAGLRIGDRMIDPHLVHPFGGFLEFEIERDGRRVRMKLRTDKVCFRDNPF